MQCCHKPSISKKCSICEVQWSEVRQNESCLYEIIILTAFSTSWVIANSLEPVENFYWCLETKHTLWEKAIWVFKFNLKLLFKIKLYHHLCRPVILKCALLLIIQIIEPTPNLLIRILRWNPVIYLKKASNTDELKETNRYF